MTASEQISKRKFSLLQLAEEPGVAQVHFPDLISAGRVA